MTTVEAVIRTWDLAEAEGALAACGVEDLSVRPLRRPPLRWAAGRWSGTRGSAAPQRVALSAVVPRECAGSVSRALLPWAETLRLGPAGARAATVASPERDVEGGVPAEVASA